MQLHFDNQEEFQRWLANPDAVAASAELHKQMGVQPQTDADCTDPSCVCRTHPYSVVIHDGEPRVSDDAKSYMNTKQPGGIVPSPGTLSR